MDQKFVYNKNSWIKVSRAISSEYEVYAHMKNGYFFHDMNELINFTNINDEEEFEFEF